VRKWSDMAKTEKPDHNPNLPLTFYTTDGYYENCIRNTYRKDYIRLFRGG